MKFQLETVLEQVVDPLSIDYQSSLQGLNKIRKTNVLDSRQSINQVLDQCDNSYLLGICYFEKYLNPQTAETVFDDCLRSHGLSDFVCDNFCALHEAIEAYTSCNYVEFLKGICFAHEALPNLLAR